MNKMNDYQLLAGYIHSESLKWSYGGFKGGDGDRWNEAVSYLDIPSLIEIITASGFRGIYIESRAYTEEELAVLLDEITNVLGYQPMVSNDGKLFFYSLYPYVALHPEVLELPALTTRDLEYPLYVNKREICFAKKGYNATQYIVSGMSGAEEEFSWTQDTNVDIRFNFYNAKSRQFVGTIECVGVFSSYQNVEIIVNERSVYEGRLEAAKNIVFEGNTQDDGKVEMTMILKDCISPKAVGVSEDSRDLALAIKSMKFELK